MNKNFLLLHYEFEGDKMKKIIFLCISLLVGVLVYQKNNEIIIPSNAIRMRIIANSNSIHDLYEKKKLKKEIENDIYNLIKSASNSIEARNILRDNLDNINTLIGSKTTNYKLDYGMNYFPKKTYKGIIYPEGNYESLVVTLGSGLGDNWWCVLYPPLCLINDNETTSNVEYQLLIKKILQN